MLMAVLELGPGFSLLCKGDFSYYIVRDISLEEGPVLTEDARIWHVGMIHDNGYSSITIEVQFLTAPLVPPVHTG